MTISLGGSELAPTGTLPGKANGFPPLLPSLLNASRWSSMELRRRADAAGGERDLLTGFECRGRGERESLTLLEPRRDGDGDRERLDRFDFVERDCSAGRLSKCDEEGERVRRVCSGFARGENERGTGDDAEASSRSTPRLGLVGWLSRASSCKICKTSPSSSTSSIAAAGTAEYLSVKVGGGPVFNQSLGEGVMVTTNETSSTSMTGCCARKEASFC